jgi:putative ABC transport system permease protein
MHFIQLIIKNLRQRAGRTAMTITGLAVAVTATTTLWHLAWGYSDAAARFYASRGIDIVVVRAGVANRLTSSLRADIANRLKSLPSIADVDGSLTEMVSLGKAILVGIPFRGLSPDGFTLKTLAIAEGSSLKRSDRDNVLIGRGISAALGKKIGDTIAIEEKPFRIIGIAEAANPFDANSIVGNIEDVQNLMGRQGSVSEFQIQAAKSIHDDAALHELCRSIEALKDDRGQPLGLKAQPTHQFVGSATESRLGSALAWAITAIVLVLSLVGVLNTMLMSVIERTKELGILRAVGWRRSRILRMILGESILISIIAAIAGSLIAWILVDGLSQWSRTSLLVSPISSFRAVIPGALIAVLAGTAGALYPASHAARVLPIESLRYE